MDANSLMIEQALSAAQQGKVKQPAKTADIEKAREAAVEFEAVFLAQMLQPMFEGIESNGLFGGGHAESMHRSMLVEEYGKSLAEAGGIGLADEVLAEMLKMQETQ